MPQDSKNYCPVPLFYYLPHDTLENNPGNKYDSLKVEIKTQPGDAKIKFILLYVTAFKTGSPKGLLKILNFLEKIIRSQSLTTGSWIYETTTNILSREALCMFEHKSKDKGSKSMANYKLVIGVVKTQPPSLPTCFSMI